MLDDYSNASVHQFNDGGFISPSMTGGGGSAGGGGGGGGDFFGALIGLGTAIYQTESQKRMQKKQNKFMKEEAELAYQREREMWEAQNAYNDPSAQMARLKAAGINPQSIAGNSGATGNAAAAGPPSYRPASGSFEAYPIDFAGVISAYQAFQMRKAQIDNVKAQTENTESRTRNEAIRSLVLDMQGKGLSEDFTKKKFYNENLQQYDATIKEAQSYQSGYQLSKSVKELSLMDQAIINKNLEAALKRKQAENMDSQMEKRAAEMLYLKYKTDWTKLGIQSGDNIYIRAFTRMLNEAGLSDWTDVGNKIKPDQATMDYMKGLQQKR